MTALWTLEQPAFVSGIEPLTCEHASSG
jgi:hypothetical protein